MMLSRGLPYSILVHAIVLVVVFMFGNHVARNPIRPASSIKVKMVHLPQQQVQPKEIPAEPVAQPEPQKEIKAVTKLAETMSVKDACEQIGIARQSYYRIIKHSDKLL